MLNMGSYFTYMFWSFNFWCATMGETLYKGGLPMAEKDITEKLLEDHNDVFADIINTLVFNGEQVIQPEELETVSTLSTYKMAGKIHSQERDVLKAWKQGYIRIAVCGIENQTTVDVDMPLRIISYDGAGYRAQLSDETSTEEERYPVITLVLYFGKGKWKGPKNLLGRVKVPKGMEALVSDYRINVFEIGQLSEEKIKQFISDFQVVADYVTQMEQEREYIPSGKPLHHIDGVMDLLEALTKVSKYKEAVSVMKQIEAREGEVSMRSAWGEAIVRGEERGRQRACEDMAKALFNEPNYSKEMIIRITKLPLERVDELEKEVLRV